MKSVRGQALIESMLLLPVIVMIFLGIAWFSRVLLTRQQLVIAARYGTDLIAMTTMNEREIRGEIKNFLCHRWIHGRKLDPERLKDENIIVTINDFPKIDLDIFTLISRPRTLTRILNHMFRPLASVSSVDLLYAFDVPAVFRLAGRDRIIITGHSEVLSGTGCKNRIHSRKPNR